MARSLSPPLPAAEIRLQDTNSQNFTLSGLRGKVVLLYFGIPTAPTSARSRWLTSSWQSDQLGADASDVRVAMITTDPKR